MGLGITIPNNLSAVRAAVRLAEPDAARGLFMAGETAGQFARNWVSDVPGVWTGTPGVTSGAVSIDGRTTALDTAIMEPADGTVLMVVNPTAGATEDIYFLSTSNSPPTLGDAATIFGVSILKNVSGSDGRWQMSATHYNAGTNTNVQENAALSGADIPPSDAWTLLLARWKGDRCEIKDLTRNKSNVKTSIYPRNVAIAPLRIGAKRTMQTISSVGQYNYALIYEQYKEDADLVEQIAQIRASAAQHGITV